MVLFTPKPIVVVAVVIAVALYTFSKKVKR